LTIDFYLVRLKQHLSETISRSWSDGTILPRVVFSFQLPSAKAQRSYACVAFLTQLNQQLPFTLQKMPDL